MTSVPVDDLRSADLLELFRTLACPTVEEMDGEYASRLLRQPNWFYSLGAAATVQNRLSRWRSKGFRPLDAGRGRGYNTFRLAGRAHRCWPMASSVAPSRYDGRPAFQLDYRAFRSLCGAVNMVDEIRRLDDGRYLGIGTLGFTDRMRLVPLPFLLEGPIGPYAGDLGRPR